MSRLVAVSNRVPVPKGGKSTGGLAVGVLTALEQLGGFWFGWSGKTVAGEPADPKLSNAGRVRFATIDIAEADYEGYYNGFSNNSLWPLCHFMLGFFSFDRNEYQAYRKVNELFAARLLPLLEPDDVVWVHDYHLIPLAAELRRAGAHQAIGFFLHVPFPNFDVLRALPCHAELLDAFASYDLVGLQTERDLQAFRECMMQPEIGGTALDDGRIRVFGRELTAGAFPIGIDAAQCRELAADNLDRPMIKRLRTSLRNRKLIIGVDRLDYSKGLGLRFRTYESLLTRYPDTRGQVVYMQIAPPTRPGVRTYSAIRNELEQTAGNINGKFAEMDWVPIRYINRAYDRALLMTLFRVAGVGLVTPVRDGMNLVAKEYVASQDPEDPGVLVLSRLAGAATELADGAVLVNPFDMDGVAEGLRQAIEMPLEERRERHRVMFDSLIKHNVHAWCRRFISTLERCHSEV